MDRANWGVDRIEAELPIFDIQLRRKRSRWSWLVSTHDGRPMMRGNAATRMTASYNANRALFLLLSAAILQTGSTRRKAIASKFRAR